MAKSAIVTEFPESGKNTRLDPVVFLSYAHAEEAVAREFCDALMANSVRVLVDSKNLKPGADIATFARQMIKKADATVCLVSSLSLASAWVVFEAATALDKEFDDPAARLIACANDRAFFEDDFHLRTGQQISQRLETIKQTIKAQLDQQLGIEELVAERSRLFKMRDALGEILARLRYSLTLVLDSEGVARAAARVADHVRELRQLQPIRRDPRDVATRAQAIRNLLVADELEPALGQLLQFVEDFAHRQECRGAISCVSTLRRIDRRERETGLPFPDAEERREPTIMKILELIDTVEENPRLPIELLGATA